MSFFTLVYVSLVALYCSVQNLSPIETKPVQNSMWHIWHLSVTHCYLCYPSTPACGSRNNNQSRIKSGQENKQYITEQQKESILSIGSKEPLWAIFFLFKRSLLAWECSVVFILWWLQSRLIPALLFSRTARGLFLVYLGYIVWSLLCIAFLIRLSYHRVDHQSPSLFIAKPDLYV